MDFYDKILKIVEKNNGYVTTKEVVKNGINKTFLTNMVKNGTLVRISRGYYGLPNYIEDEYYKIASKSKNARFSMATALYLHNLSDRTPLVYNITLPFGYSGVLQKEKNVILNFVKRELLDLGVIEITSPFGMKIKVYDIERTICDIIKNKNKMDAEIFSKALKDYAKSKNKNLSKLTKYAKALNIEKKVSEYMEVLL
jgi:predicted transcriptional regulator of viral defense system